MRRIRGFLGRRQVRGPGRGGHNHTTPRSLGGLSGFTDQERQELRIRASARAETRWGGRQVVEAVPDHVAREPRNIVERKSESTRVLARTTAMDDTRHDGFR